MKEGLCGSASTVTVQTHCPASGPSTAPVRDDGWGAHREDGLPDSNAPTEPTRLQRTGELNEGLPTADWFLFIAAFFFSFFFC